MERTPIEAIDAIVERLSAHKAAWAATSVAERLDMLARLKQGVLAVAERWAMAGNQAKGIEADGPFGSEEWLGGPMVTVRNLTLLERSLGEIQARGLPHLPDSKLSQRADGRLVAEVMPVSALDRVMWGGFVAEVWMQPGVTRDNLREHMAGAYREPNLQGAVALVLGAGNVSSIGAMDALYKLFNEGQVVVLKMNPVNDYIGPFIREAFQPLVDAGVFDVVYGGAVEGAHLCQHDLVDNVHITGSDATHDAIVWGPREGRDERKAQGERTLNKPISSELGCVTPVVVVPGKWTNKELRFQAESVATMVTNNGSFNCNAAKLLITSSDWPQRQAFLDEVARVLASVPSRKAYYPGARSRYQTFIDAHPHAQVLSEDAAGTVPWTLIPGLDASNTDEIGFTVEPFCAVLHEVSLPGAQAADFLPGAVSFCNDRVWGTLSCNLVIHPKSRRDPANEAAFQEALDDLRYGGIAVNCWAGIVYGLVATTWGAHPGHTLEDIRSGIGTVHNTFMFDRAQKSVVYAPFTIFPKPPWFVTHRLANRMGAGLVRMESAPSFLKLPGILARALRG